MKKEISTRHIHRRTSGINKKMIDIMTIGIMTDKDMMAIEEINREAI